MSAALHGATRSTLLLAIFFGSGGLTLVYQVAWLRGFYPIFGMSLPAVTAVVATFMAGQALGAAFFGRRLGGANAWRTYALLEVGIGCFGLLVPHLMAPLGWGLARLTPLGTPAGITQLARFAAAAIVLGGPAVLMGGTFPTFAEAFRRSQRSPQPGAHLGLLYAVNTLGAACGCFLTGTLLLEIAGLQAIGAATAIGNLLLAAATWLAGPRVRPEPGPPVGALTDRRPATALLALLFLTGYLGLSFELLWTRALTSVLGASTTTFSIILSAMLVGFVVGSALHHVFLARRERPERLVWLLLLLLIAAWSSFLIVGHLPHLLTKLRSTTPHGARIALCLVAFLPTAMVLGATFPHLLHLAGGSDSGRGRRIGLAYAASTAGAVTGVLLTGLVTIQHLGSGGTLRLLFVITAIAVGVASTSAAFRLARPGIATLIVLAAVVAATFPRNVFHRNLEAVFGASEPSRVLFRGEDAVSLASVVETPGAPFAYVDDDRVREGQRRDVFHSNWRGVGGTQIYLWNIVGAYLAGMLAPDPSEILIIGYGSGRQPRTLLRLPYPSRLDVVEINPLNFAVSDYFYLSRREVLGDPRVHVAVDDGRNYLLRSRQLYDVIVVDVGGIDVDGGELLYTREFLALCRDHLKPGGLVFTWMELPRVADPVWTAYERTLAAVFPDSSVWLGTGEPTSFGWLWLVGSQGKLTVSFRQLDERWRRLTASQRLELELAGIRSPHDLLALYLTTLERPSPAGRSEGLLTDDRPYHRGGWMLDRRPDPAAAGASLLRLLEDGGEPPTTGASAADLELIRQRRLAFRRMAFEGTRAGRFQIESAARLPAVP